MTPAEIYAEAHAAGMEACKDIPDKGCVGFAYSIIKPARGALVSHLKKEGVGSTSGSGIFKGYWIDSGYRGQALAGNYAYAKAMCAVLQKHGMRTIIYSRAD